MGMLCIFHSIFIEKVKSINFFKIKVKIYDKKISKCQNNKIPQVGIRVRRVRYHFQGCASSGSDAAL